MATRTHTIADQCAALATACEQYAHHVEATRAEPSSTSSTTSSATP